MGENLTGTRGEIFDAALAAFSTQGFEKSNMREIAARTGIKAASIYNHYKGKEEILASIYSYYREHFFDNLPSDEEMIEIISKGSKEEIVSILFFSFRSSDEKHFSRMIKITKLVYMRVFNDAEATDIFLGLMTEQCQERIMKLLQRGRDMGRIESMDMFTYSLVMMSSRHLMAVRNFCEDGASYLIDEEAKVRDMLAKLLVMK